MFHNATVTVNLFEIYEMLPRMCFKHGKNVSHDYGMTNPNPSAFLGKLKCRLTKQSKIVI